MRLVRNIVFPTVSVCMAAVNCFADDVTVAGRLTLRTDGSFTTKTAAAATEP